MKLFDINTCSGKVLHPLFVRWEFPSPGWVKINTNGAAKGSPSLATCGGIFRGSMEKFIGGFSTFLGIQTTLVVEFYGVIHTIAEAKKMDFTSLWLECDFTLVGAAFTVRINVSWILRKRLNTCLDYCGKIRFRISHIFHEGVEHGSFDVSNL